MKRFSDYGLPNIVAFNGTLVVTAFNIVEYRNGAMGVQLFCDDGAPAATLSVNIEAQAHILKPGEFFLKDWSENEEIAKEAEKLGIITVDPNIKVRTGFVEARVARLNKKLKGF